MKPLDLDALIVVFGNLSIKDLFVVRRVCQLWQVAGEIVLKKQSVVCTQTFAKSYFFHFNFCDDQDHFASRQCVLPNSAIRTKNFRRTLVQLMPGIKSVRVAYDPLSKAFLNFLLSHPDSQVECISCCGISNMTYPKRLKHFRIFSRERVLGRTMMDSILMDCPELEVIDIEKCRKDHSGQEVSTELSLSNLHSGLRTIRLPDCDDFFSVLSSPAMETVEELELSTRDADGIIKSRTNEIRAAGHLTKLKLEHKALTVDGHSIIIHFLVSCSPDVQELSLSFQPNLPETHSGYVQVFTHFKSLREVDLNLWRYDPTATDEVIEVFIRRHPNVRNVTLKNKRLLEVTLMRFADLKNLRRLYIRTGENHFNQDTIDEFHQLRQAVTDVTLDFNIY